MVLQRYEARRAHIQSLGITIGRARLAFRADSCTRCGLCMTGCPHGLIYSASQTFDRLRKDKRVTYVGGVWPSRSPRWMHAPGSFFAIFRLVGSSTGQPTASSWRVGGLARPGWCWVAEALPPSGVNGGSVQFVLPAVSSRATSDPRGQHSFTLNQFNLYDSTGEGFDLSQVHFYPFNPVFESSLPSVLQLPVTADLGDGCCGDCRSVWDTFLRGPRPPFR